MGEELGEHGETTPYEKVVELLAFNAYNAWSSALTAASVPAGKIRYERLANPRMGDLVLEITSGCRMLMMDAWDEHGRALGYMHPPKKPGDDCMLVALDGTITDWSNASFVAVVTPELDEEIRKAERAEFSERAETLAKGGEFDD